MKDKQLILDQYDKYRLKLLEPLGSSSLKKYKTLCKCGNEFYSRPCDVKRDCVKSCGHCNDPKIGARMGSIEIMIYIPDKANGCQVVCKCDCGSWLPMMSGSKFNSGNTKSCGHCNDPKVGERFGKLTIREVIPARHKGCKIICDCDCGGIYGPIKSTVVTNKQQHVQSCGKCADKYIGKKFGKLRVDKIVNYCGDGATVNCTCDCGRIVNNLKVGVLTNGNTKSCGFCNVPKIGDRYYNFTVIDVKINRSTHKLNIITRCDCGREYIPHNWYRIMSGNTKSCGHCNDVKVGDKFGNVTIIKIKPSDNGGCRAKGVCDCGKETKYYDNYDFISGKIVTCGNCKLRRNGVLTSFKALELHKIIEEILESKCEHNYYIDTKCFDIVDLKNKIVIEYDEYYWHRIIQDTTKKEKTDTKLALQNGFKILRIRANNDLPTRSQIKKVLINHFKHNINEYTITTPGWEQANEC